MGDWYTIGIVVGLGVALGVAAAGLVRQSALAGVLAAVVAAAVGIAAWRWEQAAGGVVGAFGGSLGATPLVSGALRRGGTRGGTAALILVAAVAVAALAFVPVLGYLEAVAAAAFGLRLRRRAPDRHAGLRTLAKD